MLDTTAEFPLSLDEYHVKAMNLRRWHAHVDDRLRAREMLYQHVSDCLDLLIDLYPNPPEKLFRAVRYHDTHEAITGDIPATAPLSIRKARNAVAARFNDHFDIPHRGPFTRDMVKLVDRLQAYRHVWVHAPDLLRQDEWVETREQIFETARGTGHLSKVKALMEAWG